MRGEQPHLAGGVVHACSKTRVVVVYRIPWVDDRQALELDGWL
jgi:hypothetical protein